MCKYVAIVLVVALVVLMAVSALIVQVFGWTGFFIVAGVVVVLLYVAKRSVPRLLMGLVTRPLRQMGAALRGSRIVVHSVTPCEPPPPEEYEPEYDEAEDDDEGPPAIADQRRSADRTYPSNENDDGIDDDEPDGEDEPVLGPLDWYRVEFTLVPPDAGSSEGRIVHRQAWNPQMLGALGGARPGQRSRHPFLSWPPGDFDLAAVNAAEIEVWNGTEYEISDSELFGEQRLRMRVGVARNVAAITITYAHFTELGEVRIPRIDVSPG
jgi:hypothetical protein